VRHISIIGQYFLKKPRVLIFSANEYCIYEMADQLRRHLVASMVIIPKKVELKINKSCSKINIQVMPQYRNPTAGTEVEA
jgi:hypothetical protein